MAHEIDPDDPRIEGLLASDAIGNLTVAGELNAAEPGEVRVYVDDPDEPRGLLVSGQWVKVWARDAAALSQLLPAVAGKDPLKFGGVATWIRDHIARAQPLVHETPCTLYYAEPGALRREVSRHPVGELGPEHAAQVNDHWDHGDSVDYVRWRIRKGTSRAVFDGDRPVSWALTQYDGQMSMMYTEPDARKRGCGLSVSVELGLAIQDRGEIPFLYVLRSNLPARRTVEKAGFIRRGDYSWFEIWTGGEGPGGP